MCVKRALDAILCFYIIFFSAVCVQAVISGSGTPIIFNAQERSVATLISNSATHAYFSRAWVSDDSDQEQSLAPFIVMPSLFHVDAGF